MYEEAGRPLPTFSGDPVIDHMVVEAVVLRKWQAKRKAEDEQRQAQKDDIMASWKRGDIDDAEAHRLLSENGLNDDGAGGVDAGSL